MTATKKKPELVDGYCAHCAIAMGKEPGFCRF